MRIFEGPIDGQPGNEPPRIHFASTEHLTNISHAEQWITKFKDLVFRYQDSLTEEAYEERLLKKGRWHGTLLMHENRPIAVHVSWTPPPDLKSAPISFCVSLLQSSFAFRAELESSFVSIQAHERKMMRD